MPISTIKTRSVRSPFSMLGARVCGREMDDAVAYQEMRKNGMLQRNPDRAKLGNQGDGIPPLIAVTFCRTANDAYAPRDGQRRLFTCPGWIFELAARRNPVFFSYVSRLATNASRCLVQARLEPVCAR